MGLIRNHYVGRTFIQPQSSIRHFGVKVKLNPVRSILEGRRVVLVDDSIVRGTTSRKIVRMVSAAGAREVHVRISCPPTISPCFYGVDTPRRSELIAATHTLEEIRKFLEADSVAYLSHEGLMSAVGSSALVLQLVLHRGVSGAFPRDEATYLQLALKLVDKEPVANGMRACHGALTRCWSSVSSLWASRRRHCAARAGAVRATSGFRRAAKAAIDKLGDLDYDMRTTASRTVRRTATAQAVPALLQAVADMPTATFVTALSCC